jgi:LysM repeat protein
MKKNPFQAFRRFFVRTRKYNTTAARPAPQMAYDEDDTTRLSGAFIIVLLLHIIAVVGVFAFARIKESRKLATPPEPSTQTAATKTVAGKPAPAKQPNVGIATAQASAKPSVPAGDTLKTPQAGVYRTHIVKENETLTKIGVAYNVGVSELIAANKLKDQNDIKAGQPITIPEAKQALKAPVIAGSPTTVVAAEKGSPAMPQKTATPAPKKKSSKTYVVQKGDTAVKIARDHGCSYDELVKLNNIKDPKKIQTGQVLKLPGKNG